MAVVTNPLLLIPAVAALLALTQSVGEAAFNAGNHLAGNAQGIMRDSNEAPLAQDGGRLLRHVDVPLEEDLRDAASLSCLQMQLIDELELLSDQKADGECD